MVAGSSGWFGHAPFAHALAGELDSVGIVNNAIENCVGERRIVSGGDMNRAGFVYACVGAPTKPWTRPDLDRPAGSASVGVH